MRVGKCRHESTELLTRTTFVHRRLHACLASWHSANSQTNTSRRKTMQLHTSIPSWYHANSQTNNAQRKIAQLHTSIPSWYRSMSDKFLSLLVLMPSIADV